jgi:hypothetical protein
VGRQKLPKLQYFPVRVLKYSKWARSHGAKIYGGAILLASKKGLMDTLRWLVEEVEQRREGLSVTETGLRWEDEEADKEI